MRDTAKVSVIWEGPCPKVLFDEHTERIIAMAAEAFEGTITDLYMPKNK